MSSRWSATLPALFVLAAACEPTPKMRVERSAVVTGEDVVVTFDQLLEGRATNQYWIALQRADAAPTDTTGRIVLERTQTKIHLPTRAPGDYEVRLHGRYPKDDHRLIARVPVKVEGWTARSGIEATTEASTCIDRWLAEHQLDPYGSPVGTQYAGGTPLFDPATGESIQRVDYVMVRHAAAAEACGAKRGETP